ncbi:MAG: hypothetical protein ABSG86_32440, partial [Thermoguttaceae bacterium]
MGPIIGEEAHGGSGRSAVCDRAGNDTIYDSGSGNNQVFGGAGTGTITDNGSGDDWIQLGGAGTIDASASTGDDWLYAGSGNATIKGSGYERYLDHPGNDVIHGGSSGIDYLYGGT